MRIPFAVRRPWLLWRGARVDRNRPDLGRLAAIDDPMDFVWAMLPHTARTFAAGILMLPAAQAPTAAVAYLYCRMLDTYEDLSDEDDGAASLEAFATRMTTLEPPRPPQCSECGQGSGNSLLASPNPSPYRTGAPNMRSRL